jgi:hypothetical protein
MKTLVTNNPAVLHENFKGDGAAIVGFSSILQNIPTLSQVSLLRREVPEAQEKAVTKSLEKEGRGLKALAEAIILQAMEDLWSKAHKQQSIAFFKGDGFRQCADAADMSVIDRLRLIRMLRRLDSRTFKSKHAKRIDHFSIK